jgi:hypothetical protein
MTWVFASHSFLMIVPEEGSIGARQIICNGHAIWFGRRTNSNQNSVYSRG